MDLIKGEKIEEVGALVDAQKGKVKYAPDIIEVANGKPAWFTRKGKPGEFGEEGNWRPKQKRLSPEKGSFRHTLQMRSYASEE